jgi:hypothetical protein
MVVAPATIPSSSRARSVQVRKPLHCWWPCASNGRPRPPPGRRCTPARARADSGRRCRPRRARCSRRWWVPTPTNAYGIAARRPGAGGRRAALRALRCFARCPARLPDAWPTPNRAPHYTGPERAAGGPRQRGVCHLHPRDQRGARARATCVAGAEGVASASGGGGRGRPARGLPRGPPPYPFSHSSQPQHRRFNPRAPSARSRSSRG